MIRRLLGPWYLPIVISAFLAAAAGAYWTIFSRGVDSANKKTEEQNEKAFNAAELAALGRSECNAARDDGKRVRWDFGTGKCVRSD